MNTEVRLGRVVCATAGRDKDKYFAIVGIVDEQYVLIADGVYRKLSHPKRKKIKHLSFRPQVLQSIADKLQQDKKVFDAELKSALTSAQQG